MSPRSKDRSSLCSFTFADGRRCRTPRHSGSSSFCYFHARKQAQARAADDLGRDISHFFSGPYLSACDLSQALGRFFTAVVQGDVKPKTARTLAFVAQSLVQTIRLAQHEFINAFGANSWRKTVGSSVNDNSHYLHPDPQPASAQAPQPAPPRPPQPAPSSQPAPLRVSVEAGLKPGSSFAATATAPKPAAAPRAAQPSTRPSPPSQPAPPDTTRITGTLRDPEPPPSSQLRPPRTEPRAPSRPSSTTPLLPGTAFR